MFFNSLEGASSLEIAFWCSALFGTIFFILKAATMFLLGFDDGVDVGSADVDLDPGDVSHGHSSDIAFKMFSIHGLTGFFMMFGWVGLATLVQFGWGEALSILSALVAGIVTMALVAYLFVLAAKLISPGAQFSTEMLVGKNGRVYQQIPGTGKGRIQIDAAGMTREIDAISEAKREIPSSTTVQVVRAIDQRTVSVKRL